MERPKKEEVFVANERDLQKRIHDLRSADTTLKLAVTELKNGYRFNDDIAHAKIEKLHEVSEVIHQFVEDYLKFLQSGSSVKES